MPNNNKNKNAWKWTLDNIRTIITLFLLIIGFTVTATTVSYRVGANEQEIAENATCIEVMESDFGEDIDELKGDMREVKTIMIRVERMLMNDSGG